MPTSTSAGSTVQAISSGALWVSRLGTGLRAALKRHST